MPLPHPTTVTTLDGKEFRCVVEPKIGIDGDDRWVFTDTSTGTRYIGPPYHAQVTSEHELRGIVVNWWAMKKALGQEGVNVDKMRGWLRDGR